MIKNVQGGAGGDSEKVDFRADSASLGTATLRNIVMNYSLDKSGALSGGKYQGLVGNGFLEQFDLVIDFPEQILYFKPGKDFAKAFISNRLGFQYIDSSDIAGGWIINGVYKSSAAQTAGLQTGDIVSGLNGKPVSGLSREQTQQLLNSFSSVSLTVKRKGKIMQFDIRVKEMI